MLDSAYEPNETVYFMPSENQEIETVDEFTSMNLKQEVLHGISSYGFEKPSGIQRQAILPIKHGRNVLAQAQSGTGKTAAFTIGMLEVLDSAVKGVQALVLAPTRELALQTEAVIRELASKTVFVPHACIGGTRMAEDLNAIRDGAQILIGTPGRMLGLIDPSAQSFGRRRDNEPAEPQRPRGKGISLNKLRIMIIDEADEMLSIGFQKTVSNIFRKTPSEAQVVLVSATLSKDVEDLADEMMQNPVKILVKPEELTLDGITQTMLCVKPEEREDFLVSLLQKMRAQLVIIYCDRVDECERITQQLKEVGFPCAAMHGKLEQNERTKIMKEFRLGNVRYIVTTNLMARGIDVQSLGIVINLNLPEDKASYLHRVGRAGRFGKKGLAINFITTEEDQQILKEIEGLYAFTCNQLTAEIIAEWSETVNTD